MKEKKMDRKKHRTIGRITPGNTYGNIKVVYAAKSETRPKKYECECLLCGTHFVAGGQVIHNLESEEKACPECNRLKKLWDLSRPYIGKSFNGVEVMAPYTGPKKKRGLYVIARCSCGTFFTTYMHSLLTGGTKTCGHNRIKCLEKGQGAIAFAGTSIPSITGTRALNKNNETGYTGISQMPNGRYRVALVLQRRQIHIGTFKNLQDAIDARKDAEKRYYSPIRDMYVDIEGREGL